MAIEASEPLEPVEPKGAALTAIGLSLLGTGVGIGAAAAAQRRRGFAAWLAPVILVLAGTAMLVASGAKRYGEHVDEAEQDVRDRLSQLDPFARVKVLKDLAAEQVPSWMKEAGQEVRT